MNAIKEISRDLYQYVKMFLKWTILAVATGAIAGTIGAAFHKCLELVTDFRMNNSFITYFMPVGVLVIIVLYSVLGNNRKLNTNLVITSVKEGERIPIILVPLVFSGTVITQFFGGSAGREGAALQIGGSIGYNLGKLFNLNKTDIHIITMAGMSGVFSALFGTPVTAAIFSLEVTRVGMFNFTGLLPCLVASVSAFYVSGLLGATDAAFAPVVIESLSAFLICKVIVLAICCALVSILFCFAIKKVGQLMGKWLKNPYLRGIVGSSMVVLLTMAIGTYDYNGAGMNIVERALSGDARFYDFLMKIIFTAITIAAGFKGGEIVPAFFVGATFGCVMGPILGMESGFAAAIGMVAVFCGAVNCPVASIVLSVEMFGTVGLPLFAIACAVSYMLSGNSSLYKSQSIVYSKVTAESCEDGRIENLQL